MEFTEEEDEGDIIITLLEAHHRLAEKVNDLIDGRLAREEPTKRERAFINRISEYIMISEALVDKISTPLNR